MQWSSSVEIDAGMDHPKIAFGEDGDFVSVWIGMFGSPEAVDGYTAEQYDRDDEPINAFAADIGLRSYNHDVAEVCHQSDLCRLGRAALARHSYGESFADAAAADLGRDELFDRLLLLYGYEHTRYPQARRSPRRVRFVGSYPYRRE